MTVTPTLSARLRYFEVVVVEVGVCWVGGEGGLVDVAESLLTRFIASNFLVLL